MRRKILLAAMMAFAVMMLSALPAFAGDRSGPVNFGSDGPVDFNHHTDLDNTFFVFGDNDDLDDVDVDFEEVGDNNNREGDCFQTNGDEITCFV
jgi:hypothetical protein